MSLIKLFDGSQPGAKRFPPPAGSDVVLPDLNVTIDENTTTIATGLTGWDIEDGIDSALMEVAAGTLKFITAPDYEAPEDDDFNNVYHFRISKTGLIRHVAVTVADVVSESLAVALANFNGTNGQSSYVDEVNGNTWTFAGGGVLSTAQAKEGATSFSAGGTSSTATVDLLADIADPDDFTVECFVYINGNPVASKNAGVNLRTSADDLTASLNFNNGNISGSIRDSGGSYVYNSNLQFQTSDLTQWYHIALSVQSGTARLYFEGTLVHSAALSGARRAIGKVVAVAGTNLGVTYADCVRVCPVALYTGASFTPPAAPLT